MRKLLLASVISLSLAGCVGTSSAQAPRDPVVWTLRVTPSTFSLRDLGRVRVRFTARNTGTTAVDPHHPYELTVDGQPSLGLGMAFGNGAMGPEWTSLPPGATATDEREGVQFVDAPGDHVIALVREGRELARTTVHVTR